MTIITREEIAQTGVNNTEQLLAIQSLENLRQHVLAIDARERKRLRKLKLDDGTILTLRETTRARQIERLPERGSRTALALDPADTILVPDSNP